MKKHNNKRSNTISQLKRKNMRLVKNMNKEIAHMNLNDEQIYFVHKQITKLTKCSKISLYSHGFSEGWKYISSHTCDSKLCFVCNWNRQKAIRRKLLKWFNDNKTIIELPNKKYITQSQYARKFSKTEIVKEHKFDVMHLVLTVPHYSDSGFRGDLFYFKKIAHLYDQLRKKSFFKTNVFGGEYGIETTNTERGLHIHIHSLILVKNQTLSRNILHSKILLEWNKLTVNEFSPEQKTLDKNRIDQISKSNSLLKKSDIAKMNGKGSTMITLETIYQTGENGQKNRKLQYGSKEMIKAILEVVKYHFEPLCFDKEAGEFDYKLIVELSPKLHRLQLYKKIGIWHGETSLNLNYKEKTDELEDVLQTMDIDEETGEIKNDPAREFYIFNPAYVWHSDSEIFPSKAALKYGQRIEACTTRQAMIIIGSTIRATEKSNVYKSKIEK